MAEPNAARWFGNLVRTATYNALGEHYTFYESSSPTIFRRAAVDMICETIPMEASAGALRYRYWLHRRVAATGKEGLVFVMLNPSTADCTNDDPTIRRCMAFARRWGYGELTVVNLFALRATNPDDLRRHGEEAIGECNDQALRWARQQATSMVVAAWGNHGTHLGRDEAVLPFIAPVMALKITKRGCPAHPLYLPKSARAGRFTSRGTRT